MNLNAVVVVDVFSFIFVDLFRSFRLCIYKLSISDLVLFCRVDITSSVPGFPLILPADEASILSVKPPKRISPGQLWTVQIDFQEVCLDGVFPFVSFFLSNSIVRK